MRLLTALLLAALLPPAHAAPPRSGLGINLDAIAYWQSDWPFIDEMKRAGGWATRCEPWQSPQCRDFAKGASANDTKEQDRVDWDENGWARRLPAADDPTVKYRQLSALLFQGNGGAHPAGRWVVLYEGKGTIEYGGAGRKVERESRPGRDVLDVAGKPGEGLALRITRIDERDHLRNIRVIGPGGVCADAPRAWVADASACAGRGAFRSLESLAATQTFHPAFVGDLTGFRALRFTKWSVANTSKVVRWRDRPEPSDALWSGEAGVPFEAMFELARATGADPWISLPPFVDDDYARRLAQLAKRSLAPGATLWFEYGNEPWNQAPPYSEAGTMYEAKARAAWPGATLPAWQQRLNWYALRSVQLCRIVKRELGADASRVRCVANAQAANAEVARTILGCELAKEQLGAPCASGFDALAIAPYVGHHLGNNALAATVDRWPDEPDGGLGKLFLELTGRDPEGHPATPALHGLPGSSAPREGALAQARAWTVANKQVAERFGLPLVAYEGGQHLHTYRGGKVEAMFRAANRDPRMGAVLRQLVDDWKAAGGELFVAFSYVQQSTRGGAWGMKEHQRDDAAPKWRAIEALRDEGCWWKGCR
ncbi:MAG TPA: hypothetical protein VFZ93_03025 [Albitalea sp.]